ncbi:MAG: helix-turn-helix transcriptional regulator [Propionibacteriaceae bacterium]|jgi:transcriptional regulator with XRE-family HTH domain|nr:helix-turn-helix transcriptional regulator [Propionibacteriaceae bacterium]
MITLDEQLARRPIDPAKLEAMAADLRAQVRAYRLREIRQAHAMTQVELAKELNIGQNRVSQIEHGDIDHTYVATLRRYVEALGGRLSLEASFGDTSYTIG